MTQLPPSDRCSDDAHAEVGTLVARAVEQLVERVTEQFDDGVDNLSRAITNTTIPDTIGEDQYNPNRAKYGFEQMIKLYLYRRVCGYNQSEIITRLKRQPYLRIRFGFGAIKDVPRQQTLSKTENCRFTSETRAALYYAAKAIAQEADDHRIIVEELAPALLEDPDADDSDAESKKEQKRRSSQQTVRFACQHAISQFKTRRAANKTYSDESVFEILARMCATNGSANSEGEYGWITDDKYTPAGSTILRAMKKIGSPDDENRQLTLPDFSDTNTELPDIAAIRDAVIEPFDTAVENIVSSINGDTPFSDRKTIAAIDITYEQIFISPWENRENEVPNESFPKMASGYKSDDDYRRGFKYATITLVGDNAPIILGIEPVKNNSQWEDDDSASYSLRSIVDRLLTKAEEFVDLDIVLFDREFYSHAVFDVVDQKGLTYITPKMKYARDYDNIESIEEHPSADAAVQHDVPSHYDGRSHEVEMVYVPSREEDGKYAVFVTNMSHVAASDILWVTNQYWRRWDIENQYKSIKDFMPRTSSMDFRVRFLNFVFASLIYNLWRLTDYLIKRGLDLPIRSEVVLGARTFARAVGDYLRRVG